MSRFVWWRRASAAALVAGLSIAAPPLHAQAGVGTIEGTVTEAGTGRPVEGAQVGSTTSGVGAVCLVLRNVYTSEGQRRGTYAAW